MKFIAFFKSLGFHRLLYSVLLCAVNVLFLKDVLNCFLCQSSLGLTYGFLYLSLSILFLFQLLFDTKIVWLVIFLFSCFLGFLLITGDITWYFGNQNKVGWKDWDIYIAIAIEGFIISLALTILFLIKPTSKKIGNRNTG